MELMFSKQGIAKQSSNAGRTSMRVKGLEQDDARATLQHRGKERERTGKMRAKDLTGYFHYPITAASKEINV
ncbi:Hypothetical predicted protein [Olea europaea subsp. europaea]|uniref:Uncharacterized protein n=1 Tax=Olea europaea subsp. europaea TaxID=158383 RepID=A0A8S0TGV1_OLEEU|nr:Hypothetical predicted protein [Olea europaea subsp. europaea]